MKRSCIAPSERGMWPRGIVQLDDGTPTGPMFGAGFFIHGIVRPSGSAQSRESSMLQYAMHDRLTALGWSPSRRSIAVSVALPVAASHAPVSTGWSPSSALGKVGAVCGTGDLALCPQQPRSAATHLDVPGRRHRANRSGDGLCVARAMTDCCRD